MPVTLRGGKWVVVGKNPDGLSYSDVMGWETQAGQSPPECFGDLWDGVGPQAPAECQFECVFSPVCMELTAKQALPAAQIALGVGHSLQQLSEKLGIGEATVLALLAYLKGGACPSRPKQRVRTPTRGIEESVPLRLDAPAAVPEESSPYVMDPAQYQRRLKASKPRKTPPRNRRCRKGLGVVQAADGRWTLSVEPVRDLASAPKSRGAVRSVLELGDYMRVRRKQAAQWGQETFRRRWERERARDELIRQLEPGWVLRTLFRGRECVARVLPVGYEVLGIMVPTLYAATLAYVGIVLRPPHKAGGKPRLLANYSARKFWKLFSLADVIAMQGQGPWTRSGRKRRWELKSVQQEQAKLVKAEVGGTVDQDRKSVSLPTTV